VALSVRDVDVSAAWYADVFGFEELFREDAGGRRGCVMRFPGGGFSVALVQHPDGTADGFDARRTGLDHAAFMVSTRDELDRWADGLTAKGIEHSGAIAIPPGAILNLKDPDGIALALFWDDPAASA
jgi:glyoxylase I family protein